LSQGQLLGLAQCSTTNETTDLTTGPELVKRAAILIYRLTRWRVAITDRRIFYHG
jgi:hypothetical protein